MFDPLDYPLESSLEGWYISIPGRMGGVNFYDLAIGAIGTLTNMSQPFTSTSGWAPSARSGGSGELRFNGTSNYITIPWSGAIDTQGTLSFWFKPTWSSNDSTFHIIFNQGSNDNTFLRGEHGNDNNWYIGFADTLEYRVIIPATSMVVLSGTWYFLTFTWSNASQISVVYLNGIQKGSNNTLIRPVLNINFEFGRHWRNTFFFSGAMDNLRLHNRPFTPQQVGDLYSERLDFEDFHKLSEFSYLPNPRFVQELIT